MTDDELRDAYAMHLRRTRTPDPRGPVTDACASPEDVLALVRREGPEARRLAVLDHVMGCARCRAEFDLLRAVEAAGQSVGGSGDARRSARLPVRGAAHVTRRWAAPVGLALAASIVVMIGVRQYGARPAATATDVQRDVQRGTADDVALVAPAAGAVPGGAPLRFVWHAVPQATRYEVEVLAPDGTVAFAGATADTVLPLTDARRLALGVPYQWWVRAVGDAGGAPRQSAMRPLRVTPR